MNKKHPISPIQAEFLHFSSDIDENTDMRNVMIQHRGNSTGHHFCECLDSKGCYVDAYKNAGSRNDRRLLASAMATLKRDLRSWRHEESMEPYWLEDSPAPTTKELYKSGGMEAVLGIIRRGDLIDECGIWTGDFWKGLKDSGVAKPAESDRSPWTWRVRLRNLPELAKDMEEAEGVLIKVARQEDSKGRRRVRSGSSLLPEPAGTSPGWLAGVLSGMVLVRRLGVWVLESPGVVTSTLDRLKDAGVWHCGSLNGGLWVSPFYLPLVAKYGPPRSMGRWETIREVKGCDILAGDWLPLSTWEVVFGHEVAGRWPTSAWSLPWAIGHATRARLGIDRRWAHLAAVSRGVGEPAVWLKGICNDWRSEHGKAEEG